MSGIESKPVDLGGTWRMEPPQATLRRILRPEFLDHIGVTRVAYIDGLDRLGFPTVAAHRPRGSSLSTHQGKGVDHELATISAVMEAVECDRAERFAVVDRRASLLELLEEGRRVVTPADLPGPRLFSIAAEEETRLERDWVRFHDLGAEDDHLVPASLVRLDFDLDHGRRRLESRWMPPSTNGIAAGNDSSEAILHAICEVVERHAMAAPAAIVRMDLDRVGDPLTALLAEQLERRDLEIRLQIRFGRSRNETPFVRIPAYRCVLVDHGPRALRRPSAYGAGAHPNPRIAILRAITEAVQARTSLVAGARDDVLPEAYMLSNPWQAESGDPERIRGSSIEPQGLAPTELDRLIEICVKRLADAGFDRVLERSLDDDREPADPVPVHRVVIPGMHFDPGAQRARAALQ